MENILRKLAKSNRYQFLYARTEKMSNIKLFNNNIDFSYIQIIFLQWLQVYYSLYEDLYMKEEYISQEVIDDELRTDAYLLWKNRVKGKKKQDKKSIDRTSGVPSVIFKRK